jgi:hypothetical protein
MFSVLYKPISVYKWQNAAQRTLYILGETQKLTELQNAVINTQTVINRIFPMELRMPYMSKCSHSLCFIS